MNVVTVLPSINFGGGGGSDESLDGIHDPLKKKKKKKTRDLNQDYSSH